MMPFVHPGLGDATAAQLAQTSIAAGAAASSAGLAIAGATAAIPIVGLVAAPVALFVSWLLGRNSQYQAEESATSNDANLVEQKMQANVAAYQSCQIDQPTAEANYNTLWAELVQACQQIGGSPGQRCVTDREQGACTWTNDGAGGPVGSGDVCWNWYVGYYQPLTETPTCASSSSGAGFSPWLWAALGAGLLIAGTEES